MDSPRHCTTDPEVRALDLDEQFRIFFDFLLLIFVVLVPGLSRENQPRSSFPPHTSACFCLILCMDSRARARVCVRERECVSLSVPVSPREYKNKYPLPCYVFLSSHSFKCMYIS